jgi:hypothetical protein
VQMFNSPLDPLKLFRIFATAFNKFRDCPRFLVHARSRHQGTSITPASLQKLGYTRLSPIAGSKLFRF